MKKINKKEKGAALINVMLVVLIAVAIGLPLLYLTVVNFMFRMFDNNLRSISYMNEIGMDNVYAIIQEVVISESTVARDKAREIVDTQIKAEQDAYKAWTSDGRNIKEAGEDGIIGTDDDITTNNDDLTKLKKYMYEYGIITIEENNDDDFEVQFKYLDITDGSIVSEAVKSAYNTHFKTYYKDNMDGRDGTLEEKLKDKSGMREELEDIDEVHYALKTEEYKKYLDNEGTSDENTTSIKTIVYYRGKSETTRKYINSEVSATFTIGVPEFDSASSINQTTVQISNPLLDKTLVIGDAINIAEEKNLSIKGNSIVNGEGVILGSPVVNIDKNANLYVKGKLSVNGDINLVGGTSNSVKNTIVTEGDVFCNEIRILGEYTDTNINGTLYIADDMEFNKKNTNMVVGTFMGFNDEPNDANKNSAVLFNDKEGALTNVNLDITNSAYIAGTAFLGDLCYKTGESTAIRGNYRAYQSMMKDGVLTIELPQYSLYRVSNMIFNNYGSISLVKDFIQDASGNPNTEHDENTGDMSVNHKTNYFMAYTLLGNDGFLTSIPRPGIVPIKAGTWKLSTGAYYDSVNSKWQPPIGSDEDEAIITNAKKDYDKYTKYFGYGEGNEHRLLDGNIPTVVGDYGWINSDNIEAAADKYSIFDKNDEIVVLVSKNDLTLTEDINNKKGIIIAGGNITIDDGDEEIVSDITFSGILICGGKLIVNENFTLINDSVGITKIIDSAVSVDDKELFKLFEDDGSGNLYTYSTIDTQMASINMNDLIKISNWKKSKFDI